MLEQPVSQAERTRVRFDQIATQINDRVDNPAEAGVERYVGLEHLDPDSLRIRRWGEPTDVESTKLRFQTGDIIFGKRRVYQRKVAVADFEGICSAHAMVLRAKTSAVLSEFLPFFMQSDLFMERALSISVGSLSPTINWKALAAEEFMLPPIQVQARLVEALSGVERTASLLEEAATRLQHVGDALFENIIVHSKEKGLIRNLAGVCTLITDGTHQPPEFAESGVPFLFVKSISGGNVNWSHISYVSQQTYDDLTKRNRPKQGDVLYTAVGATYGVAVAVDFDNPFVFQRHIAHLVPDPKIIRPEYLTLFLNSRYGKQQADASAVGSAQPTITLESLRRYWCPCPPLETQREQLIEMREIHRKQKQIYDRLTYLQAVRRTIMEAVF